MCTNGSVQATVRGLAQCALVDHTFFDVAFDIYRRRYNDGKNKVVFLAVSDDENWIKVNRFNSN